MSTLAEIETAITALPRAGQAELLRFVAGQLRGDAPLRRAAELARPWSVLSHLRVGVARHIVASPPVDDPP